MKRTRKCVLVADAARARLFTYGEVAGPSGAAELFEVEDLVSPARRKRDSELFDDSRPGLRQAQAGGPRHGVDDHRDDERDNEVRRFANEVLEHATAVCERLERCPLVVVCSSPMLGHVRASLARAPSWLAPVVQEQLPRDLTSMRLPQIHDWLAASGALPARERPGFEGKVRPGHR